MKSLSCSTTLLGKASFFIGEKWKFEKYFFLFPGVITRRESRCGAWSQPVHASSNSCTQSLRDSITNTIMPVKSYSQMCFSLWKLTFLRSCYFEHSVLMSKRNTLTSSPYGGTPYPSSCHEGFHFSLWKSARDQNHVQEFVQYIQSYRRDCIFASGVLTEWLQWSL